ncbi:NERD domain-containing protein [Corynebacterium kalidii]|uniref:non-specific serine/threonine protein kinase n=1 Tax=Corynebacterium kalidii TaxID=2931982 RepID=A0A9X2B0D1_9CORY|nr:NERD domain-containing protein [Corynebacterium kalidii]MCJ7859482.1 NERD domain-containing protein [Corynebacterium kalidii]
MEQSSKRWIEVTPSEFVHERDGLEHLARAVPDQAPYYVFSNFTFQGDNGRRFEVDALVISPAQVNLIELKSWSGHFTGNEHNWRSDWNGGSNYRNPLNAANYKAKLLATRLGTILKNILREHPEYPSSYGDAPWVQESVFLHSENIRTDFTAQGMQNVFGIDGRTNRTNLPGIGDRITEKPRRFRSPVDQGFAERVLVPAIKEITGYRTRRAHAGPWLLNKHLDDEEDRQVWEAVNRRDAAAKTGKKDRAIVRVADIPRGADRVTANRLYSLARREYELLKELSHPGIEAPFALEIAETPGTGESPALIYRPSDGFEPLDLLYPGLVLTAAQQVEVISQVADAVTYAHANNAVHRRLTPSAVLLNTRLLDKDDPSQSEIQVKVSRWTAVTENVQSTRMRSAQTAGAARSGTSSVSSVSTTFDEAAGFLPPEGFDGSGDRTLGDLFSVGALAFFIFSGGRQPATSRAELTRVLSRSGGLDLDSTDAEVEGHLRDLVLGVTAPSPVERLKTVKGSSNSGQKENPVKLFLGRLQGSTSARLVEEGDALHPKVGETLADRFEMLKQLGTGSTALGLLVNDTTVDARRVLKVARDESKVAELEREAESLGELATKLEGSPHRKHFVELLEPTLRLPFDRSALLLSFGGEFTLADQLQMGPLGAEQFWTHGEQLLTLLVALENTGLTHRDIKPANLGLKGKPSAKTLVLFDFSLAHRSLTETDLGTRPYLDPFLSSDAVPSRPHFDGYAERYSALVVLLQMATADYPRYGDDDGTAVELTDGHLALTPDDLPEVWPLAQREALTELFRVNLDRDVRGRAGSAQELLELFRSIRRRGSGAQAAATAPPADAGTSRSGVPAADPQTTSDVPLRSLKDLCEELIAYSGDKNTHERRLVSNILGVADKSPADPFDPPSVYATILDASPGKMPRLTASVEPLWRATPVLHRSLELLQGKLAATLRSMGGIATPEDLRPVVDELFPSEAVAVPTPGQTPAQNARRQLGVLRLMEMALSRRADGDGRIHLIRRQSGDATSSAAVAIALTDDPALTGLPAVLAESAYDVLAEAPHELVDAGTLNSTLSAAAVDYLGVTPAELQVSPSMLPQLAVGADAGLAVTATGDLYPVDMSTEALVRAVFPTASMKVPRSVLSNKVLRRFPEAVNRQLPAHPVLTDIVTALVPDMHYDASRKEFFRPQVPSASDELVTRHTNTYGRTVGLSDRPRAELPEADRKLLDSLETTLRDHNFRVVQVETGKVAATVALLDAHMQARHVDVGEVVLDELWHLFEETNQTDKFDLFLEADSPGHPLHAQLGQLIRLSAQKALTNALSQANGGQPVVLTHPSILASFGCLDLLSTWSQIGAQNAASVWLVTTDDAPSPTNAHAVDGVQLPLSSPDQVLSY